MNENKNLSMKQIHKIFIANRGEVAHRVIRTAHDRGYTCVAAYADSERDALFVRAADEAYSLAGNAPAETYMNSTKLIDLALRSHSDAVHPGYGFLSENADFARAVIEAGLVWIGPDPSVLERLGDKISARQIAQSVGVCPVPGLSQGVSDPAQLREFVAQYGYPVAVKSRDGGGGRGIYILRSDADMDNFLRAHAEDLCGSFIEKFIETARHIETQCMRDMHGNFSLVSTRDCSVQRRNQKLIEEAPAPGLSEKTEQTLEEWSLRLFEAVDYHGMGTCEFLVEEDTVYFLEVNPRLQVEHTVSEEVTGVDLVAQQLNIAQGKQIAGVSTLQKHSFEFRITAEDPAHNMLPSQGEITHVHWPLGHGVRVESGIEAGSAVTAEFDSLLAKIIVTGQSREEAIARSVRALREFELQGVAHVAPLYLSVIASNDFRDLRYTTRWFEEKFLPKYISNSADAKADDGLCQGANRTQHKNQQGAVPCASAPEYERIVIEIDGRRTQLSLPKNLFAGAGASLVDAVNVYTGNAYGGAGAYGLGSSAYLRAQPLRRASRSAIEHTETQNASGSVCSPVQAIVVRVIAQAGAQVREGELLMVLESMKMESYVYAPVDGTVKDVAVSAGDTVQAGALLVEIESAESSTLADT